MNGDSTVRVYIEPQMGSRGRRRWTKAVTAVDHRRKFGYSFLGEFLGAGQTDVPEGAILVQNSPRGSTIKPRTKWTWTQVRPGKLRWSEPIDSMHFLDFRDQVTEALALAMAGGEANPPNPWEAGKPTGDSGDGDRPAKARGKRKTKPQQEKPPAKPQAKKQAKAQEKPEANPPAKAQAKAQEKPEANPPAKAQAKAQEKPPAKAQAKAQEKPPAKTQAKTQAKAQEKPPAKPRKPRRKAA